MTDNAILAVRIKFWHDANECKTCSEQFIKWNDRDKLQQNTYYDMMKFKFAKRTANSLRRTLCNKTLQTEEYNYKPTFVTPKWGV